MDDKKFQEAQDMIQRRDDAKARKEWVQVGEDTGTEVTIVTYHGKWGDFRLEIDVYRADITDPSSKPEFLILVCPVCEDKQRIRAEHKPFRLDGKWPETTLTVHDRIRCSACYRMGQSNPFQVTIKQGIARDA